MSLHKSIVETKPHTKAGEVSEIHRQGFVPAVTH